MLHFTELDKFFKGNSVFLTYFCNNRTKLAKYQLSNCFSNVAWNIFSVLFVLLHELTRGCLRMIGLIRIPLRFFMVLIGVFVLTLHFRYIFAKYKIFLFNDWAWIRAVISFKGKVCLLSFFSSLCIILYYIKRIIGEIEETFNRQRWIISIKCCFHLFFMNNLIIWGRSKWRLLIVPLV